MPPLSTAAFARALRGLTDGELAALVADVLAARGFETRVEGRTVVARDGRATRRLRVAPRGRLGGLLPGWLPRPGAGVPDGPPPGHDAVVVRSVADGAEGVVDAAALRGMALYAVDPGTRDRLFRRHLGRPASATSRPAAEALRSAPVAAAVLLLIAAAAVGALAAGLPGTAGPEAGVGGGTPTPAPAEDQTPEAPAGDGEGDALNATGGPYPFGASPYGIESAERLARTHAIALAPTAHRWRISYREVVDGRTRGHVNETVWVENATVYRSSVERSGDVRFAPIIVPDVSTFANGSVRFDRIEDRDGLRYRRHDLGADGLPRRPFEDDPYNVITWYLSVQESWLVGTDERAGVSYHRYAGRGDSWPRTTGIRVRATVDEFGVVHRLRRTHRPPDTDTRVVVTYRVTGIGNTTVAPPPWLEAARRATGNATAG